IRHHVLSTRSFGGTRWWSRRGTGFSAGGSGRLEQCREEPLEHLPSGRLGNQRLAIFVGDIKRTSQQGIIPVHSEMWLILFHVFLFGLLAYRRIVRFPLD